MMINELAQKKINEIVRKDWEIYKIHLSNKQRIDEEVHAFRLGVCPHCASSLVYINEHPFLDIMFFQLIGFFITNCIRTIKNKYKCMNCCYFLSTPWTPKYI